MNIETLEKRVCELEHLVFGPTKSVKRLTTEHEKVDLIISSFY